MVDIRLKKERFKKIRGLILYHLVRSYPGFLDHYEIRCFLDNLRYTITEEELSFHVAYLKERGFVRAESRKSDGMERELIFATADGILALDGRIKDAGIDVESLP